MRSRTRQLELTTNYFLTISCTSFLQTLSLAGSLGSVLFFDSSKALNSSSYQLLYSPEAARHCLLGPSSPLPTALLRFTDQCSPLVTVLAYITRTVHPRKVRSVPYLTLPRQRNRMSSPTVSNGSASTVSCTAQSQYQDRLISMSHPTPDSKLDKAQN